MLLHCQVLNCSSSSHDVLSNVCAGAVVCMQMVASARPDMQRSRMTTGHNSMAGSMLLRAATMGPGQYLNAEAFPSEGEARWHSLFSPETTPALLPILHAVRLSHDPIS